MTERLHVHSTGEHRPVEVLVLRMDPADVEHFLAIDHEVWTLGEAATLDGEDVPFLSKEVWLDDSRPGEVTIVFVWPDQETWDAVASTDIQQRLQSEFDQRFGRPYELTREVHHEREGGLHRWSRFARPG
ncbi:MAG: TIGR03792 family protein [Actinomycetota bacterium]